MLQAGRSENRIPVGGCDIFRACPYRQWGPPSLLYNGHRVFTGGEAAGTWRLSVEVKKEWNCTSTPRLSLRDLFYGELNLTFLPSR